MGIDNQSVKLRQLTKFIKAQDFFFEQGTTNLEGPNVSTTVYAQMTGLNASAWIMGGTGQIINATIDFASEVDWSKDVHYRVWWSSEDAAGSEAVLWRVRDAQVASGSAAIVIAAPTVLDTIIASQDTIGTAQQVQVTARGTRNANTYSNDDVEDTASSPSKLFHIAVDTQTQTPAENVYFHGVEMIYTPRYFGDRSTAQDFA